MRIALLGNQARAMSNFWTVLIRRLVAEGHDVLCIVPNPSPGDDPAWEAELTALGARLAHFPLDRKGLNPIHDLQTFLALRALFAREKPDRLFAYTIKTVIYGTLAAAFAGRPAKDGRHVMITGLGYAFEANTQAKRMLMRVTRFLYRLAFSHARTVFFQNEDDRLLFEQQHIIPNGIQVCMCRGTGVDLERFSPAQPVTEPVSFLFVGRLLEAKGLRELHEAARILRSRYPGARFLVLGPEEKGLGSVPLAEVLAWQKEGLVEYLGETRDVRPFVAGASVLVLPSWREGTPCSLLEGMSMSRALVAADAPGSREAVRHGENGFLVPLRDPKALASAMEQFMIHPELIRDMGNAGRLLAEREFDARNVADQIMRTMEIEAQTP